MNGEKCKEIDDVDALPDALKGSLAFEPYNEECYRLKFDGFLEYVYPLLVEPDIGLMLSRLLCSKCASKFI